MIFYPGTKRRRFAPALSPSSATRFSMGLFLSGLEFDSHNDPHPQKANVLQT
jgi:hypothetical protein